MIKKGLVLLCIVFFVCSLTGCATGRKQKELEIQGLRNQVSALEVKIQAKDEEIWSLKASLESSRTQEKAVGEIKTRPNSKQIQMALKNAGFDPGSLDGRMGGKTREAIKAFQKANDLVADGKVGKETWELLRKYLYEKVK